VSRANPIALCLALGSVVLANINCVKCGEKIAQKAVEGAVEKASGGKAKIDVGGNVDLSDLPAFLRYPGASAKARWAMSKAGTTGTVYTFETADAAASVVDFYKKALAGWKNVSTMESGDATILVYGTEDEKQMTTVTVAKDSGKTSLTLLYTKRD